MEILRLVLLSGLSLFLMLPSAMAEEESMAEASVGKVEYLHGEAEIWRGDSRIVAEMQLALFEGDRIVTGESSRIRVRFSDDSTMQMGENAESIIRHYRVESDGGFQRLLELVQGRARFIITKLKEAGARYEVKMRAVLIGVRGTDILAQVAAAERMDHIALVEGRVSLSDSTGRELMLEQNHYVNTTGVLPQHTGAIPDLWLADFIRDMGRSDEGKKTGRSHSDNDSPPSEAIRARTARTLGSSAIVPK